MDRIERVFIHHSGTRVNHTLDDIEQWHSNRGFYWEHEGKVGAVGYHFAVGWMGEWMSHETHPQLRPRTIQGASIKGMNENSLAVVIFGSHFFSMNQWWALGNGVYNLLKEYKLEVENVYGHGELADTECPGLDMDLFRKRFIKPWR